MTDPQLPSPDQESLVEREYRAEVKDPPGEFITMHDPENPKASIYANNAVDVSDHE
jgi:hypothetical protein